MIPLFERFAAALNNLEIIDIYYLHQSPINYARLDSILLRPSFSKLREVRCVVYGYFGNNDVLRQPPSKVYDFPDSGSLAAVRMA